jgi:signal transduction histidine kinase
MRVAAGIAVAALCTLTLSVRASAQVPPPRTVLIIYEGAENFPSNPLTAAGIRETLKSRSDVPINDFEEYLESDIFPQEEASRAFEDYIRRKYQNRRIDLVIATTHVGLRFVLDHRAELFPDTPIVFLAVDVPGDTVRRMGAGAAGVRIGAAYGETLKQALALHPSTEHVFVVDNRSDRAMTGVIRAQFRDLTSRATLTFIDEPTVPRLLAAIKDVPSRSLILYMYYWQDAPHQRMYPDEVALLVAGAANVPVYGTSDVYVGSGVVGGVVRDAYESGTQLGSMALRILTGTRAQDIPIEATRVVPIFDWRAMQRWGISERRLPLGSLVRFRGPSLWRDYRREVLAVLGGLLVQSLLIIGLLYQRRARRRAEVDSRRSLALAADAQRRVTVSALSGSVAHELSQPLNAILHNAQAGEMLVASDRATPDALRAILSDIRAADVRASQIVERHRTMLRNHQLDMKPVDIHDVVRESVALVAHDTNAKHVTVDVDLPPEPCVVVGDQVLLLQVLVNLMMNAMEAMVETPPDRRRLRLYDTVNQDRVEVSVEDAGTGLPPELDGRLFEPFVTTKANGMGIGLTIAHTIVDAHRGTMKARNNPDGGGATFSVTLPRKASPSISELS